MANLGLNGRTKTMTALARLADLRAYFVILTHRFRTETHSPPRLGPHGAGG